MFSQWYRRLALDISHTEFFRTQVGGDVLPFGRLLRVTPGPLQSSERKYLGIETVRIRVTNNIRDVVAVADLKPGDDLVDNRGINQRTICCDPNHNVRGVRLGSPVKTIENIVFA